MNQKFRSNADFLHQPSNQKHNSKKKYPHKEKEHQRDELLSEEDTIKFGNESHDFHLHGPFGNQRKDLLEDNKV